MRLYFMRHGHAEDLSADGSDESRAITPAGFERLGHAAEVVRRLGVKPVYIFSSPRLRAKQTAETVADALQMTVSIREEVNFGFSIHAVRDFVAAYPGEDLMFVGHEPTMSQVVMHLTGASVSMKKGALARVDLYSPDATRGELVWLITPKVFDALVLPG